MCNIFTFFGGPRSKEPTNAGNIIEELSEKTGINGRAVVLNVEPVLTTDDVNCSLH